MLSYLLAGSVIGPVVSQSLLDLSTLLIFVCFVFMCLKSRSLNTCSLRKPFLFEYGFIFYFLAIILGFFYHNILDPEAWQRLYKFYWVINFYLFYWALSQVQISLKKLLWFFVFAFILPNLYSLMSAISGYDWLTDTALRGARIRGLTDSATYHAHGNAHIFIFFFGLFYLCYQKITPKLKWSASLALALMGTSIFLTYTRGVWLSLFVGAFTLTFLYSRKLLLIATIAGVLLFGTLYKTSERFQERITHSMQTQQTDTERWHLWKVHVMMVKESPIWGIGYADPLSHTTDWWPKMGLPKDAFINSHAHNQILNVWATTGLIGLIPFLIFNFWFLFINFKLVRKFKLENKSQHFILAAACFVTQIEFFVANLTEVGFEYSKIRSLIVLVWALVFTLWQNKITFSEE